MAIVTRKHTERKTYTQVSRANSAVDNSMLTHHMSASLVEELRNRVMSEPNEQALAVLRSIGMITTIPHNNKELILFDEIARFYGVSASYLSSLLNRRGFIGKKYPQDIVRLTQGDFLYEGSPITRAVSWENGTTCKIVHKLSTPNGESYMHLPQGRFNTYSPRAVLAIALYLGFTEKNDGDSVIKRTMLALKHTRYRFPIAQGEQISQQIAGFPVMQNGDMVISIPLFTQVVKAAVSETVSEALKSNQESKELIKQRQAEGIAAAKAQGKHLGRPRIVKPENWDAVFEQWQSGQITALEAMELTGTKRSTFYKLAK